MYKTYSFPESFANHEKNKSQQKEVNQNKKQNEIQDFDDSLPPAVICQIKSCQS